MPDLSLRSARRLLDAAGRPAALLACLLVAACANTDALKRDHDEITRLLEQAREYDAVGCAPVELATAQAHEAFARLEFEQGHPQRARDHLDVGLTNARAALDLARDCAPADADGDGITDDRDQCPDLPEDFDDYQDEDGCPELDEPAPVVSAPNDMDGDGIPDDDDDCPAEVEDLDFFKDIDGCPDNDNDNDGVPDTLDDCPKRAEDRDGYDDEDGCPDNDNDGDGLLDVDDACPDEPGEPGGDGCPNQDSDGDGVMDGADQCPDQPETPNDYLDEDGCPDEKPQNIKITKKQIVIEEQIQFASGRATILSASHGILDGVVQVLNDYPEIHVRIEGHTDNVGNDDLNLRLSKERADSVFEYLLAAGVNARRMETIGYGETRPIDTNRTEGGRANNRRVEFHITQGLE